MRIPVDLPTAVVSDTFTDADSTSIASHTPTTSYSGVWSQTAATSFYIQSNQLVANRFTDGDLATIEAGLSDLSISCSLIPFSTSGNRSYPGLVFRYVDSSNFWYIYPDSDNDVLNLYRVVSGTHMLTMGYPIALSSAVVITVEVRVQGPNITIFLDGRELVTYVSTVHQTGTKVGVRVGKSGSPATAPKWDSFTVRPFYGPNFNWLLFSKYSGNPIVQLGASGSWEDSDINDPNVIYDSGNSRHALLYSGYKSGDASSRQQLGIAYTTNLLGSWTKDAHNPLFEGDGFDIQNGGVVKLGSTYYYYYGTTSTKIAVATSPNLITWTDQGEILLPGGTGAWDEGGVFDAFARLNQDGKTIELWYAGTPSGSATRAIGVATSTNGTTFTKSAKNPIIAPQPWASQMSNCGEPSIYVPSGKEGKEMLISFDGARSGVSGQRFINQALTVDGGTSWHYRIGAIEKGTGWESVQCFDSFIYEYAGILYIFYAGADTAGTALGLNIQIGVASVQLPSGLLTGS